MVDTIVISGQDNPNPTLEQELAARDAADAAKTAASGKILGKFTDQAALETGYSALEAESTRMAQELAALKGGKPAPAVAPELNADGTPKVPVVVPVVDPAAATDDEARSAVEGAGVDFDALRESYDTNGELSEDDYAALEKGGIPRSMVEEYVAGQEAIRDALSNKAYAAAGGDASAYAALTAWAGGPDGAGGGLTPAEIDLFNTEVNSGDAARITFAVSNLKARHEKAEGLEPTRILGGKVDGGSVDVFESWAQVSTVMQTKAYKTDPAVQAAVQAKLGRSNLT